MRVQAVVNVSENIFDPYYCIQSFVAFNLGENALKSSIFVVPIIT